MPGSVHRPAPLAEALWDILRQSGEGGVSAKEAATRCSGSIVYARRALRLWEQSGYATYLPPETTGRADSGRYVMTHSAPAHPPILHTTGETNPRESSMSPAEFAAIRRRLGLSLAGLARAIGRTGHQPSLTRAMRRMERGESVISPNVASALRALLSPPQSR